MDRPEERKLFEEKLIANLAACPDCRPSKEWLGRFAWNEKVRRSGLWNNNFVDSLNKMTGEDLERFEQLVLETKREIK